MNPLTVAFFGISGSGKGTQCELLEKRLTEQGGPPVIRPEMGKLLRGFMETRSSLASLVGEIVGEGQLVPSFIPIYLLTEKVNRNFDGSQHIIFDGTCRRPDQSRAVDDMMRLWGRKDLHVVVLKLSPESAKKRLVARGRFDDEDDKAIAHRLAWYEEQVVPSIEELRLRGWIVHEVDGEPDIETIHTSVLSVLGLA